MADITKFDHARAEADASREARGILLRTSWNQPISLVSAMRIGQSAGLATVKIMLVNRKKSWAVLSSEQQD